MPNILPAREFMSLNNTTNCGFIHMFSEIWRREYPSRSKAAITAGFLKLVLSIFTFIKEINRQLTHLLTHS